VPHAWTVTEARRRQAETFDDHVTHSIDTLAHLSTASIPAYTAADCLIMETVVKDCNRTGLETK